MMGIREDLHEVLQLQESYSPLVTEPMAKRGAIIRHSLPDQIQPLTELLRLEAGVDAADFLIEGSDGQGRRALVPWVRFGSRSRSPTATKGWYVVFLFRSDGTGAYLALAHASNNSSDGGYTSRSTSETTRLVRWSRDVIANDVRDDTRLSESIQLGTGKLGRSYEATTAISYFYPRSSLPNNETLISDLRFMARLLGLIYSAADAQERTQETSLDVIDAVEAIEESTTGRRRSGQGFGLTPQERRAVELRAMAATIEYLTSNGFSVEDTSSVESYDLKATQNSVCLHVEVKGTTGTLGDVVLTRNEVDHHLACYPNNALFVLSEVRLIRSPVGVVAEGGTLTVKAPWNIEKDRLRPIAFRYRVS